MKVPAHAPITQAGGGTHTQYHFEERRTGCLRRLEPSERIKLSLLGYKASALSLDEDGMNGRGGETLTHDLRVPNAAE